MSDMMSAISTDITYYKYLCDLYNETPVEFYNAECDVYQLDIYGEHAKKLKKRHKAGKEQG